MIDGVVDIKKYFWDADPDALDYNRHYFWIIERLLEFGGDREVAFLFNQYGQEKIEEVIKKSRVLSPKTVNYWCLILNIRREDTFCFSRQYQPLWQPY
jgi:hypothetical protein